MGRGRVLIKGRPAAALLSAITVAATLWSLPAPSSAAPSREAASAGLSKHDRGLLAQARAEGRTSVSVLVAAKPGANRTVDGELVKLGGKGRYRDDDLGYLRHEVPINSVETLTRVAGVQAVQLDEVLQAEEPRPAAGPVAPPGPPGPDTPAENPYLPTRDIGAPQFVRDHPTFDGRGTTIGIVDTGIDLFTPELQTAKLADGTPTRKITDWVTTTDPLAGDDPTWVDMHAQVTTTAGRLIFNGSRYTAPGDGAFRIGLFDERFPGEFGEDVNRDGNPPGASRVFAVLWDTAANTVWVDANQNRSFADEPAMTDYKVRYDVGTFGTDNPSTPERETVPFVVQTDGKHKYVNIGIVSSFHGTHVAGIAAGKDFFGGAFDGAAPEARVVSVRACHVTGCTIHGMAEGMIYAVKRANVDVANMSLSGLVALNDGNEVMSVLFNRLTDQSNALIFVAACNFGPGINTIATPSTADLVMDMGASVHAGTAVSNYGVEIRRQDALFEFSGRGPREDGGFKPDAVAPGSAVSAIPAWLPGDDLVYPLPPGYAMRNGTSMASPQGAGAGALLVSAAAQSGVKSSPNQLRQALNSSARFLPGYGAHEQGNGLLQVGSAWELLRTNIRTVEIKSSGPAKTVQSSFLQTPDQGQGIYEREGWSAGQSATRTITFTRTSGGARPVAYNLAWIGNDGTFQTAGSVALPHNQRVSLPIRVSPLTPGVHSALLRLDDPTTAGVDYAVMNTVVAAHQLGAGSQSTVSTAGEVALGEPASIFLRVPPNVAQLTVELTGDGAGFALYHPSGVPLDLLDLNEGCARCEVRDVAVDPDPGVWEVAVVATGALGIAAVGSSFVVKATIHGVGVDPSSVIIDDAIIGTPYERPITFTNRFAAFTGEASGGDLGSAFASRPTITRGDPQMFEVDVPVGSTAVSAQIGDSSDPAADIDLYLFDCTGPSCVLRGQSIGIDSEEGVMVTDPAPGQWRVVVISFFVPAGAADYDYMDVVSSPAYGSVDITDDTSVHPEGTSWTRTASITAAAPTPPGRPLLVGAIQVKAANGVIGSSQVRLTPAQ